MSLQEEIYSLFYSSCFDEGGYNEFTEDDAQKIVNKVLDAAIEAVVIELTGGMHEQAFIARARGAINKLREGE